MPHRLFPVLLALATLLVATGCQSIDDRIKKYPEVYNGMDPATQAKIKQGIIEIGYTPDMVYLVLGAPDQKRETITAAGKDETWIYNNFNGSYYGGYYGGYYGAPYMYPYYGGMYYGPYFRPYSMYNYPYPGIYPAVPEERVRVIFKGGRVAVVEQLKE